jgi:flagellar assembly protein FliH
MPEVRDGQIIQVEKLQQRGPRGELVNLEKDTVVYNSMTAGQLEEISNQAYEEVREQAYQDGLKQGHDEGYQAGLDAASHTLKQQAESLQATINQLHHYLGGQDDEVEQALVNVATCVASAVLRRELSIDSSQIRAVVNEAIASLPMDASNITIFLGEADYCLLKEHADIPDNWQLQQDSKLTAGGCRVTSRHSVVDYTLEEQFQQSINSLVEQRFAVLAQQAKQRSEQQPPTDSEDGGDVR